MRKIVIAGNWKMHLTPEEGVTHATELIKLVSKTKDVVVVLCPAFPGLRALVRTCEGSNVQVGAQNVYPEEKGAFTGEVSPGMIKATGARYVIVGHSERREIFGETDEFVRRKIDAVHREGMIPIVCIGESLEEREAGKTTEKIGRQLDAAFVGLSHERAMQTIVAYEPIWAIGTGKTATPEQAQEIHKFIRKRLSDHLGPDAAAHITIQYGGSVKPANALELLSQPDIDGALVGGASLTAESFAGIVNYTK